MIIQLIQVGEEESDIEDFKVHSNILSIRSTYFNAALSSNWVKKDVKIIIFKKPNIFRIKIILYYYSLKNNNFQMEEIKIWDNLLKMDY